MENHDPLIFPFSHTLEPEDLYVLSAEYKESLQEFNKYLKSHKRQFVTILVKRLNPDTTIKQKLFSGKLLSVQNNGFTILTSDSWGAVSETPVKHFFRTDNPLGDVPVISENINPYVMSYREEIRAYIKWLNFVRDALIKLPETPHYVRLDYKYTKQNSLFREGNFHVIAKIKEVNHSNLELYRYAAKAYVDKDHIYANIIPTTDIDRYLAPDRYLHQVTITEGIEYPHNPYDEE